MPPRFCRACDCVASSPLSLHFEQRPLLAEHQPWCLHNKIFLLLVSLVSNQKAQTTELTVLT